MNAQDIAALLEREGIIVDKRWGEKKLRAVAAEAGITLPAESAALEGADDLTIPDPGASVKVVAPAKSDEGVQCISLTHALHISRKDLIGEWDNGMSKVFNAKDRFKLKSAALAEALEARGQIVVVK
jgi:hypothetical protein